jgi:hypothetical protein
MMFFIRLKALDTILHAIFSEEEIYCPLNSALFFSLRYC